MAHGDARYGKWRGNWRMEWVVSTLHTTSEHVVSSITTAGVHTSATCSRLNWRPRPFKWIVRFAESRNMVSVGVELHFKRRLHLTSELFSVDENWEGVVKGLHKRKSKQCVRRFINWFYNIHRQTDMIPTYDFHKVYKVHAPTNALFIKLDNV